MVCSSFWKIQILWSGLAYRVAASSCFGNAIPPELRKNVAISSSNPDGYPLGMWPNDWAAGHLTSDAVEIIIKEILGFHTVRNGPGGGTVDGFFAVAGCATPKSFEDRGCGPSVTYNHIVVEGWTESYMPTWLKLQQDYPDMAPKNLGNMGYYGKTSMYLSEQVQNRAWEAEGLNLEFYRGYNVSWHNAAQYFDPPSSIDRQKLKRCNETRLTVSEAMEFYAELTGDSDGIETVNGQVRGRCWDEYFWYPPSCRNTPLQCLPFLTAGTGWNLEETMQKATAWNMQIAPVVALSWGDFTQLPSQGDMTFYWWIPDPTFLELKPVEIGFPAFDRQAHSAGDKRTSPSSISIDKYVSRDLSRLAPVVEEFMKAFRIEMRQVNEMLMDQLETGDSSEEVACRWLKANEKHWTSFLPDETQCFAGFGLHDEQQNKYVSDRIDPTGLKCKVCLSGMFSEELIDDQGSTFVCKPCGLGTSQASGASLACSACPAGQHQDEEGSSTCKRCGIGRYQDLTGQELCKVCPLGTTTPGLSSSTVKDCGCFTGSIDMAKSNMSAQCVQCGEGLACPFHSTFDGLKSGSGAESHLESPSIKPGYHSTATEPTAIFKCADALRCPGGLPGSCGSGLKGIPCAECGEGRSWDGEQCAECSTTVVGLWIFAGLWAAAMLPIMYLITVKRAMAKANLQQTVIMFFTMSFSLIQIVALIGQMTIKWPSIFQSMTSSSQVLLLNLDAFRVSCVGGSNGTSRYIFSTLAMPVALGWLFCCYCISRCLPKKFQWQWSRTLNTMGALMQGLFNVMSSMALQPFMCYKHPNGSFSMVKFPAILCGEEDHTIMKVTGLILLVVVVGGFLTIASWAAWKMPTWGAKGLYERVASFIFLFNRFRMDRWWFGVPLLLRGPLLSLPVVWAADLPEAQITIAAFVLSMFLFLQVLAWPWKVPLLNVMDTFVTLWLLVLLLATPIYNYADEDLELRVHLKEQFSAIIIIMICLALTSVLLIILIACVQQLFFGESGKSTTFLNLSFGRRKSAEVRADMLGEMAREVLKISGLDLAKQLKEFNPHDLARIDACIELLATECNLKIHAGKASSSRITSAATKIARSSLRLPDQPVMHSDDKDDNCYANGDGKDDDGSDNMQLIDKMQSADSTNNFNTTEMDLLVRLSKETDGNHVVEVGPTDRLELGRNDSHLVALHPEIGERNIVSHAL